MWIRILNGSLELKSSLLSVGDDFEGFLFFDSFVKNRRLYSKGKRESFDKEVELLVDTIDKDHNLDQMILNP